MTSTHKDAIDALRSALADVDSAAGAKLAFGRVATRFRPTADPVVGKSWLTTEIVACVTTGRPLPGDEFGGEYEPINVLLLNAEDGAGDTIRHRLDRAGADVEPVHIFDGPPLERGARTVSSGPFVHVAAPDYRWSASQGATKCNRTKADQRRKETIRSRHRGTVRRP